MRALGWRWPSNLRLGGQRQGGGKLPTPGRSIVFSFSVHVFRSASLRYKRDRTTSVSGTTLLIATSALLLAAVLIPVPRLARMLLWATLLGDIVALWAGTTIGFFAMAP